ncbi:lipocalin-like domain-containing protein [Larkinella soli]|uniref:lipocalin family protein n=1 Tax=Larkinella soli TaxID=1770527 RepID=UPI000FFC3E92|nr:lipocalin family protein [Larkinella soli]
MKRLFNLFAGPLLVGLLLTTPAFAEAASRPLPALIKIPAAPAFVGKSFRVAAFEVVENGKVTKDLLQRIPDCEKDNTITFLANGTVADDNGLAHCPDGEPANGVKASWSFDGKQLKITDKASGETSTWEVIEQNADLLKVRVISLWGAVDVNAQMTLLAN